MTNKEIAREFSELADLMELHDANPHKVRTYRNAYMSIRRFPEPIEEIPTEAILDRRGIGKSVALKIEELLDYGEMSDLQELRAETPEGVRDLLAVKGLGPKKIKTIWKDLGVENVADLIYACQENRLVELKGFGAKTQSDLLAKLEFYMAHRDKVHYATAEKVALAVMEELESLNIHSILGGELLRCRNIIDDIKIHCYGDPGKLAELKLADITSTEDDLFILETKDGMELRLRFHSEPMDEVIRGSEVPDRILPHLTVSNAEWGSQPEMIPTPELWDNEDIDFSQWDGSDLIRPVDVRGVIHNHSVYSDGSHTVEEMALACRERGYEYLVMSDHSRSAFYANGLDEDRVRAQWKEIDDLNDKLTDFKIFKSIESDILYDGYLDYPDDLLKGFDLVIASVHSQLKMDEEKATSRLLKAIQHPATRILGHMTGRLLLGREGYPVDHARIIDACATHDVVIELNANPYRLDMDWRWIQMAREKGVMISINPDAHHIDGIDDIRYGVLSARKGGLLRQHCLCCKSLEDFETWLAN